MNTRNFAHIVLSFLLIVAACQEKEEEKPGSPPTVNAGPDITGTAGNTVALNGSGTDPDGDPLNFVWSIVTAPDGSKATINNPNNAVTSFVPDIPGAYTLQLAADDGVYDPATDEAIVTVEEAMGEPPVAMIRDKNNRAIGEENNNNTMTITTAYLLDGSGSFDPDEGDVLTYAWSVTAKPENSSPEIQDNDISKASFIPDLPGEYTIQLEVKDQNENVSATTVIITANADPVVLNADINANTTLRNIFTDPELPDYLVTADIGINAELTILPGVKVLVQPTRGFAVNSSGAFIAKGTADSLIVLMANDTDNGWKGITFFSPNVLNELDYVQVIHGGSTEMGFGIPKTAIGIENGDKLKITNSLVAESKGYGIFIENGGMLEAFENNVLKNNTNAPMAMPVNQVGKLDDASDFSEGNGRNSVEIYGSTIDEMNVQTFPGIANHTPYYVSGDLIVKSGVEVLPGAIFEFAPQTRISVEGNGTGYLTAIGTAADSIIFTAADIQNGWEGILFRTADSRNELTYCRIAHGGSADFGYGVLASNVGIEYQDKVKITNSVIEKSKGGYGLYLEPGGTLGGFANNKFRNNAGRSMAIPANEAGKLDAASTFSGNGDNSVEIYKSSLNSVDIQTWPNFTDGTPYFIAGDIRIETGLIIEAGATLEFKANTKMTAIIDGYLTAVGTPEAKITFTARDATSGWLGLSFNSTLTGNKLHYAIVSYGGFGDLGSGLGTTNVGVDYFGKVSIANSEINNGKGYGIFVEGNGLLTNAEGTEMTTMEEVEAAGNTLADNALGALNE